MKGLCNNWIKIQEYKLNTSFTKHSLLKQEMNMHSSIKNDPLNYLADNLGSVPQ